MKVYYDIQQSAGVAQRVFPLEQVRMISAQEGYAATSSGGDPLFKDVRLRTLDEQAVAKWIDDAMRQIEVRLRSAISSATYTGDYCQLTFKNRYTVRDTQEMADEAAYAAACYALSRWLDIRLPEKAAAYLAMFTDRVEKIAQYCLRKDVPVLDTDDSSD